MDLKNTRLTVCGQLFFYRPVAPPPILLFDQLQFIPTLNSFEVFLFPPHHRIPPVLVHLNALILLLNFHSFLISTLSYCTSQPPPAHLRKIARAHTNPFPFSANHFSTLPTISPIKNQSPVDLLRPTWKAYNCSATSCFSLPLSHAMCAGRLALPPVASSQHHHHQTEEIQQETVSSEPVVLSNHF